MLDKIKNVYNSLTKQQKKVADYVIKEPTEATFKNSKQIAELVNVSQATVLRFTKELGFSSFAEFILELQHDMLKNNFPMQKLMQNVRQPKKATGTLSEICKYESENVYSIISSVGEERFQETCDLLNKANSISFIGCRSSYSLVYYVGFTLSEIFENVSFFSSNVDDAYQRINKLGKGDVVFSICFYRYTRQTIELTRFAKSQNTTVISMTDQLPSPLFSISDILLHTPSKSPSYSYVSSMALLDAIIQNIVNQNKEHIERTLPSVVEMLLDNNVYF